MREVTTVEDIFCNCCGKSLRDRENMNWEGLIEAKINWGYCSHADGTTWIFSLCEKCLLRISENWKISPIEKDNEN